MQCPCVREDDGLAKSSRNVRLTPEVRKVAPQIYATLQRSLEFAKDHTVEQTHDWVVATINAWPEMDTEYFSICDGITLQPVTDWDESDYIVGCITVYCGKTPIRLIDHIKYKGYIEREKMVAEKMHRLENIKIRGHFNYEELQGLSTECRQKLMKIQPETLAQASRIPGVSPSDINVLLVLMGR